MNILIGFSFYMLLIYAQLGSFKLMKIFVQCDRLKDIWYTSHYDNRCVPNSDVVDTALYDGTYHQIRVRSLESLLGQTYMVEQNS